MTVGGDDLAQASDDIVRGQLVVTTPLKVTNGEGRYTGFLTMVVGICQILNVILIDALCAFLLGAR